MTGAYLATVLRGAGFMPPLLDADGEPFEWLPCTENPRGRDEEASYAEHVLAVKICRTECPALDACRKRRRQLGRLATGVWGGRMPRHPEETRRDHDRAELADDPVLAAWAADAGVTLPMKGA